MKAEGNSRSPSKLEMAHRKESQSSISDMPKTMNADLQQELGKKKESQIMSVTDLNVKKGEKEL